MELLSSSLTAYWKSAKHSSDQIDADFLSEER